MKQSTCAARTTRQRAGLSGGVEAGPCDFDGRDAEKVNFEVDRKTKRGQAKLCAMAYSRRVASKSLELALLFMLRVTQIIVRVCFPRASTMTRVVVKQMRTSASFRLRDLEVGQHLFILSLSHRSVYAIESEISVVVSRHSTVARGVRVTANPRKTPVRT